MSYRIYFPAVNGTIVASASNAPNRPTVDASDVQAPRAAGNQFALARYTVNGDLDHTFDGDGRVTTNLASAWSEGASAIAIDEMGCIVTAGSGMVGDGFQFALARHRPDGLSDPAFDLDGTVQTDIVTSANEEAEAVAIDGQGRIIVAGHAKLDSGHQFALARYHINGSLDRTFDGDGTVLTNFAATPDEYGKALAIDGQGRIIVAGYTEGPGKEWLAVARYLEDGALDPTFDVDGKVLTNISSTEGERSLAVAIDSSDRVVVAGHGLVKGKDQMALARYRSDGSLDPTFDRDGKVLTDFASAAHERAYAIAIDSRNRIVVAGYVEVNGRTQLALARYATDGGLDPSFGIGGEVLTDVWSAWSERVRAVAIDDGDRIVVAGDAVMNDGTIQFVLARYRTDGSLDPTFHEDGKVLTAFDPATRALGYAVAIDAGGHIVVAGEADP